MGLNIERLEALPTRLSMRESALKIHGGDLHNYYDSPRLDQGWESREAGSTCRKDWRVNGSAQNSHDSRARRQIRFLMRGE